MPRCLQVGRGESMPLPLHCKLRRSKTMPPVKEVTELRSRGTTTTAPHTDVFQATERRSRCVTGPSQAQNKRPLHPHKRKVGTCTGAGVEDYGGVTGAGKSTKRHDRCSSHPREQEEDPGTSVPPPMEPDNSLRNYMPPLHLRRNIHAES
jgi:hypothetical protein